MNAPDKKNAINTTDEPQNNDTIGSVREPKGEEIDQALNDPYSSIVDRRYLGDSFPNRFEEDIEFHGNNRTTWTDLNQRTRALVYISMLEAHIASLIDLLEKSSLYRRPFEYVSQVEVRGFLIQQQTVASLGADLQYLISLQSRKAVELNKASSLFEEMLHRRQSADDKARGEFEGDEQS